MRILLLHRNDGSDPRLLKIAASLTKAGHEVIFVGWDIRAGSRKQPNLNVAHASVFRSGRALRWGGLRYLHRFCAYVFRALLNWRPEAVHCVNEEMALLVLPWKGLLFRRLVCDLFDSMKDRGQRQGRWALNLVVRAGSWLALSAADRLIATDDRRLRRLGRFAPKAEVIANVPCDPGPELSRKLPTGPAKVFLSGSIDATRGLEVLQKAVHKTDGVSVVAAGWCTEASAEHVLNHDCRIEWHGQVSPEESLYLAAGCDAVFAYYEPCNANNIYASPNKVFDALSVGRPVIINSETVISSWVVENKLGYAAPYYDVDRLAEILSSLRERRETLAEFAARARSIYEREFTWEIMEKRLLRLYDELAAGRR